jgi:hypothetical protein
VIAYYQIQLQPLGWTQGCSVCSGWTKPGYYFEINTLSAASVPSDQQGYGLVYNEILREDTEYSPLPASGTK